MNNKINAKQLLQDKGQWTKKPMNLKRYLAAENTAKLPNRAPEDTRRVMRHQGHENEKVISKLRKMTGKNDIVHYVNDIDDSSFETVVPLALPVSRGG